MTQVTAEPSQFLKWSSLRYPLYYGVRVCTQICVQARCVFATQKPVTQIAALRFHATRRFPSKLWATVHFRPSTVFFKLGSNMHHKKMCALMLFLRRYRKKKQTRFWVAGIHDESESIRKFLRGVVGFCVFLRCDVASHFGVQKRASWYS